MNERDIEYIYADESWRSWIAIDFGEIAARHMHFADGVSILALYEEKPVGLLSTYLRKLAHPLSETYEAYIDIVEVLAAFRRKGIAKKMVELAIDHAVKAGAYQMRGWSSQDKTEAIQMWKALGFGLCPATVYPKGQQVNGYFVTRVL